MRLIVMFDLPTVTPEERSAYARFRKNLIQDGYIMMQESIYSKLATNMASAEWMKEKLRKIVPLKGVVQVIVITEKQYGQIEYLLGSPQTAKLDSVERLVIF